jgi:DNA-binding transcriptional LysR family regulator
MDFDLRLLRHARALAEEGSFGRAARTLNLSQPALSRSIQDLEQRTGIRLFDRGKGRVEPTDLGRLFLEQARELLDRADALDRSIALYRGTGTGRLVIGSGTFATAMFMAEAVAEFVGANPGVGLRVVNDSWSNLIAALRRRELDLVVAGLPGGHDSTGLLTVPLATRQGYFLARPGHPLFAHRSLALGDVLAYPIVSTTRFGPSLTEYLLAARSAGTAGRSIPDLGCESLATMAAVAARTDHLLLAPLASVVEAVESGALIPLPLADPGIRSSFAVVRLENRTLPPVAEELIRAIVVADRESACAERTLPVGTVDGQKAIQSIS